MSLEAKYDDRKISVYDRVTIPHILSPCVAVEIYIVVHGIVIEELDGQKRYRFDFNKNNIVQYH